MSKDVTVIIKDEPGELAALGEATGAAGVNIQGMAGFRGEGRSVNHLLFDDDDRPGTLGHLARALGGAGVNIELAYTTFGGITQGASEIGRPATGPMRYRGLVVATDDMEAVRAAL